MNDDLDTKGSNDDLLNQARAHWNEAFSHWSKWRTQAKEDYSFVDNDQWDSTDKAKMIGEMRPVVQFNRIQTVVKAVAGSEVSNRQEVKYFPREEGDARVSELMTSTAMWVRDGCDAEDEESDAFVDMVICGLGCTETHLDYTRNLDGDIVIDRVDPMEMYPDPNATKRNLDDKRYVFRVKDYPRSEFKYYWPDAQIPSASARDTWGAGPGDGAKQSDYREEYYEGGDSPMPSIVSKVRVAEYQWCEYETVYRVADPSGQIVPLDEKRFKVYRKQRDDEISAAEQARKDMEKQWKAAAATMKGAMPGIETMRAEDVMQLPQVPEALQEGRDYVKQRRKVVKQAFFAGSTVLQEGYAPVREYFTYNFITGSRDRNENTWYGIVRVMKDPQRWANKFFSSILHIINNSAKGGVLVERNAVADPKKFQEDWANPTKVKVVENLNGVREQQMSTYPNGLADLMQYAISSIRDVSGVNLELLGLADRQQAGYLEAQRKQAGMTVLATMFDALRRYRKEQGRVLLKMINEYIADGRLVRVVGDEGAQYVPLMKQDGVLEYDVIVDEAPSSPNNKEKVWGIIQAMMPTIMAMPAAGQIMLEILPYTPLPESLVTKLKEMAQSQVDPNAIQAQQQAQQLEQQGVEAEIANTQADTAKKQAEAQKIAAEAGTVQPKLQLEAAKQMHDAQQGVHRDLRPMPPGNPRFRGSAA